MSDPITTFEDVTPEQAKDYVASNFKNNRPLRLGHVNDLAREMREGRWTITNDAVCFSDTGKLLNGQHRLHAVVQSGVTIRTMVVRNMPEEAFSRMDDGVRRTVGERAALDAALVQDVNFLSYLLSTQTRRLSVPVAQQMAAWWQPAHERMASLVPPTISRLIVGSVPVRVGVGLRWAISGPAERQYVEHNYALLKSHDTSKDASPAVFSLLGKLHTGGSRTQRVGNFLATFICFDPARASTPKPYTKYPEQFMAAVRAHINSLDAARQAAAGTAEPYVFPTARRRSIKLRGAVPPAAPTPSESQAQLPV